jgi:hypothetical protein
LATRAAVAVASAMVGSAAVAAPGEAKLKVAARTREPKMASGKRRAEDKGLLRKEDLAASRLAGDLERHSHPPCGGYGGISIQGLSAAVVKSKPHGSHRNVREKTGARSRGG